VKRSLLAVLFAGLTLPALAGGPLEIFDAKSGIPYRWPNVDVPVFLDTDGLGILDDAVFLDKAAVDARVAYGLQQWNDVPSATFHGHVAGDLASLGLGNVTALNFDQVLGAWNGGGIHVVYDQDGSIHDALFGPYSGVLGFAEIEWVSAKDEWILEVTMVLNGAAIPTWETPEVAAAQYTGVITHELGHGLGLAHSQTNGQVYFGFDPSSGPEGCPTPWAYTPGDPLPASSVETMYPFLNLSATGVDQSSVDRPDDIGAFSRLYPEPSFKNAPYIRGVVSRKAKGKQPFTGANVIARNVNDPFGDAVSALSGDYTQGRKKPDGRFELRGLTAGASYALYVDGVVAGAFSTPSPTMLPGAEEYWNGAAESGDGITDDRCAFSPIVASAGAPQTADVVWNVVKGAPEVTLIDLPNSWVSSLSEKGTVGVGGWDGGHFRWTPGSEGVDIGGPAGYYGSPQPAVSANGKTIVGTVLDKNGYAVAAFWKSGKKWAPIGGLEGATPCDGLISSAWGVSNSKDVVGLGWDGCSTTGFYQKGSNAMSSLGTLGDSAYPGSRADAVSADGRLVVGWDQHDTGYWRGVRWDSSGESLFQIETPATCDADPSGAFHSWSNVGTAMGLNADGTLVVGEGYPIERSFEDSGTVYQYCDGTGWIWSAENGVRSLGEAPIPDFSATAADVDATGSVATGILTPVFWGFENPKAMIWTPQTGMLELEPFLEAQGTFTPGFQFISAPALADDGRTIGGLGFSSMGQQGFVLRIPTAIVCHESHSTPVAFPQSFSEHLVHGDTIGLCGNGM
jgi:hypothetical protein